MLQGCKVRLTLDEFNFLVSHASKSMKLELCSAVFFCRYTTTVNQFTVWMVVTRTRPAGCGLFVAPGTNKSKTCLHSSITLVFSIEHSLKYHVEQSYWSGTMTTIYSTWGYPWGAGSRSFHSIYPVGFFFFTTNFFAVTSQIQ